MKTITLEQVEDLRVSVAEDTTVIVNDVIHCKAIHCLPGCNELKLRGTGKLIMEPDDSDFIAIGRPPMRTNYKDVWEIQQELLKIDIREVQVEFKTSNLVQWIGVYGNNRIEDIHVDGGANLNYEWTGRRCPFCILSNKYVSALRAFDWRYTDEQLFTFDEVIKFFFKSGVETDIISYMIVQGEEHIAEQFQSLIATELVALHSNEESFIPSLQDDLLKVQGSIMFLYCLYDRFYRRDLDRDILIAAFVVARKYEEMVYGKTGDYYKSEIAAWTTLCDESKYDILGTVDLTAKYTSEDKEPPESVKEFVERMDKLALSDNLEEALMIIENKGGSSDVSDS